MTGAGTQAMSPKAAASSHVSGPSGRTGPRTLETPPRETGQSSIRRAHLADIPAITRIAETGLRTDELDAEAGPRWMRLFLAQVVLEYGALWVEQGGAGQIVSAMIAVPVGLLSLPQSVLRDAIGHLGEPPTARSLAGFGHELLVELTALGPTWLLSEISSPSPRSGDAALLTVGLAWASAHSGPAREPVTVLAHWTHERTAAERLGFVERRTWTEPWAWWLGVTVQPARADLEHRGEDRDLAAKVADRSVQDSALQAALNATRSLLWIATPADVAPVVLELVRALGGEVVEARTAGGDALPVDISFGLGEPILPTAPAGSVAHMLLERWIPGTVRDALRTLELAERSSRLAEDAAIDPLTGLHNRRMLGRVLGRLGADNTVIMIDLDHFKAINDTLGHVEGDRVLRALGKTLGACVRATESACRYGGDEFVVVVGSTQADAFLDRLRVAWIEARPHPITFSAGVAPAALGPARALEAADRAMYRAKLGGRDQFHWATSDDYV